MNLHKVEPDSFEPVLRSTLSTLFSQDETLDLMEGLLLELEEGSHLYSVKSQEQDIGFVMITPLADEESLGNIDLISVEDIFVQGSKQTKEIADSLSRELKTLTSDFDVPQIEVIISQSNSWLSESLVEHGFISSEVKLEKLLPRINNLDDVLELIQDCTPIDRIVQVLLEREEAFQAEFVESSDELSDLIDEGWEPVMVVVTYEPDTSNIEKQIEESDQLINWDDYSIVYYG